MIQSHLVTIADAGSRGYLVYDTVLNGRHTITACGVGRINDRRDDADLTAMGRQTLEAFFAYGEHADLHTVRFWEIATVEGAAARVRKALEQSGEKDGVFFVCQGPDVYDAAVLALNLQRPTAVSAQ